MKRKICVVITARPSYSRIRSTLFRLRDDQRVHLDVVVAGSAILERFGGAKNVIMSDGFTPSAEVSMIFEGDRPAEMARSTGVGVLELAGVFERLKPDVVVTIADRYETMATAIAASYMGIPLAHIQGGEVTGNIDEKVRHAVTKLSDIHLVATAEAQRRVIALGERPETVFLTGCPSIDLAAEVVAETRDESIKQIALSGVGSEIDLRSRYLVVLQHPVTSENGAAGQQITETLEAVAGLGIPTLWFWPNVDAGSDQTSKTIRAFREVRGSTNLRFVKNVPPLTFLRLALHADCLIGNSSVGVREAGFLGTPVVNIGTRQSGRERGPNVYDVGYERAAIAGGIKKQIANGRFLSTALYGDGNAATRISETLIAAQLTSDKKLTY